MLESDPSYDIVETTSRGSSEHQEGCEGRDEETHHCSLAEEDSHGAGKGGCKGSQEEKKALVIGVAVTES